MNALKLYKAISGLEIDWRGEELVLWVDFMDLPTFVKAIASALGDGGIDVNLQDTCVALDLVPICEHYGIDPEEILEKEAP